MSVVVLDHIRGITYDQTFSVTNECHPFAYLPEGIHRLALSVRKDEIEKRKEDPHLTLQIGTSESKENYISCEFHWFATSLVNYARSVGFVEIMEKKGWTIERLADNDIKKTVKQHCTTYAEDTLGDVYIWRNKVAAHFSSSDAKSSDNIGTLQHSIMYPITYMAPYYFTHALNLRKGENASVIPKWSLTKQFEEVSIRFFPERKIP